MARKRTDLDKAISKALHNTRNKVYRLKKRGASDEELRYIDPRRNDWRAARAGIGGSESLYEGYRKGTLSGKQKYEFLQQLQEFNNRENSYTVTDDGGFISSTVLRRYFQTQESVNDLRKATLDKILLNSDGKSYGQYYQYGVNPVNVADMDEWDFKNRVARDLAPVNRTNPFSNAARLVRGINTLRSSMGSMRKVEQRNKQWHKVAVNKLKDNGQTALAEKVAAMSDWEFLRMTVLTDFNMQMGNFQYVAYWTNEGHQEPRDLEAIQDEKSAYFDSLVDAFAPRAAKRAEKQAKKRR